MGLESRIDVTSRTQKVNCGLIKGERIDLLAVTVPGNDARIHCLQETCHLPCC